ncbi:MAG: hypothetical protein KDA87_11000 [Planctomycetales bacterium]|nr:hypothetical protein [Planctomycetales bacterium]
MSRIDQFESVFKAADKTPFQFERMQVNSVLLVTDLYDPDAAEYGEKVRQAFPNLGTNSTKWSCLDRGLLPSVDGFLGEIKRLAPDFIFTFRNLLTPATEHPYSLGVHLDVMTQATDVPIMVLPSPHRDDSPELRTVKRVMAITDHMAGQNRLVSIAASLTPPDGELWLSHVEDETTFERYIQTISKIPDIETDVAKARILEQLLKEPHDYVDSCRKGLADCGFKMQVHEIVTLGHRLRDYRKLLDQHQIDLLVLNTKDQDQLAMHGVAYPLSVELRNTPLLLL